MPIYIQDSSPLPAFFGKVSSTMGAFTANFDGTSGIQPDIDGSLNRAMGDFRCRFIDTDQLFPLLGNYRIGTSNWGDNPDRNGRPDGNGDVNDDERTAIANLDFIIINGQQGRGSGFVAAVDDMLDWRDANASHLVIYEYTDIQEAGDSGSETANKLSGETGPNGLLDWWVYDDYTAGAGANKVSSFPGSEHTNLTRYVTPDAFGEIFPEWYANYVKDNLLTHNTPTNVRLHIYNDVTDHRHRAPSSTSPGRKFDYNGDGVADNGRNGWQDGGLGQETAEAYREGHRIFFDRLKADTPGLLINGNTTTWGMENDDENFVVNWRETPHTFYDQSMNGGLQENITIQDKFPVAGVRSTATGLDIDNFGSWRLAVNQMMASMFWQLEPNHTSMGWSGYIDSSSINLSLGGELNPLVGSNILAENMQVFRWGLCSTLLTNGFFYAQNARRIQNSSPMLDEFGVINQSTTGLDGRKWMGAAVDADLITREFALGASGRWIGSVDTDAMFKREFQNAIALVNTNKSVASSADITITVKVGADEDNGELESGKWKEINGAQDSSVNQGRIINTSNFPGGYTIGGIDGRVLQRT